MTANDRKKAFLMVAYSAKFAADTLYVEPPQPLPPTDENLRQMLAQCARPPREHELGAIRDRFQRDYGKARDRITGTSELSLFEMTP